MRKESVMNFREKVIIKSIGKVTMSEGDENAISRFISEACERA